jgi:hypothetical protein
MTCGSRLLIGGVLVMAVGCAHGRASTDDQAAQPAAAPVRLNVTNHFTLPVEVYVTGSGIRQRLGTVSPNMDRRFVVPPAMVGNGPLEFRAEANGGAAQSGSLLLSPGDQVDFVIGVPLFNSTATVHR